MKPSNTYVMIVLLLLLSGCESKESEKNTPKEQINTPTVLVDTAKPYVFNTPLSVSGIVKPDQKVMIFAMSNGYLKENRVDIGDAVKEGQILGVLDNPELSSEKLKLQAQLKGKAAVYKRLKSIYKRTPELTSVIDVEVAQAEFESLQAQVDAVTTQIAFLTIRAPFSGIITGRFVDKGAVIQSSLIDPNAQALYELQDVQPVRVSVEVSESDAAFLTKGLNGTVVFPELPNLKVQTAISRTTVGLNPASRTMEIQLDIPNSQMKILSGMYAKVMFERSSPQRFLALPNEAIGNLKGEAYVYVVKQDKAYKVKVKTGVRDDKYTQIIDGNITQEMSVVIQGKELCADGTPVKMQLAKQK
ncbi:MAG TPA: efflux RND transporter periplasmic adaptor subunit [Sulfurovum sp.]|nr:MAG: hypothetical protein B7Y63_03810 [Sulfurovum sp. 35-42-20]OYZ24802.1 MAG: hypothetical protein B7Y23_08220 [Sulfurovum sp. 16-42-52]OYZ49323.1 MAG: hypothetical protein B7Y13_05045 [Sulfurovum sp. 24-42-9]OZA44799.1 MAG: hypothetical protein B7X80_06930 [Sulfurovum sp. 17-42-90]OZA59486.1 MAG: hypothetical protein B7X69_07960 [Sulfurovum sp. 39-42-12]HQR73919.1 efflux RND transporter periplasmic adaptor subunit [Sulfurovum sp.]